MDQTGFPQTYPPDGLNNRVSLSVDQAVQRLVSLAINGDRAAKEELFVLFRNDAFRAAFRVTGRQADAMDVVQDSFIKAFDRLGSFQGDASFKTWLLRIVTNQALDALRKRRIRLAVSLDGGGSADSDDESSPGIDLADPAGEEVGADVEQKELGARIQAAIDKLPPDQKSVFAMYAAGELTYHQIAETLGIPIGTVMSRLYHARRKLRDLLPELAAEFAKGESDE